MHRLLREMERLYSTGLQVQVGDGEFGATIVHPALVFIACDNKEAATLANIKSGQTNCPCRICECTLRDMQLDFNRFGYHDALRSPNAVTTAIAAHNNDYIRKRSLHVDIQVSHIDFISLQELRLTAQFECTECIFLASYNTWRRRVGKNLRIMPP